MSFAQITTVSVYRELVQREPSVSWQDMLSFPITVQGICTPFREQVLSYIYRTARGLSNGLMESATVEAIGEPGEEDSLHLHLALTLRMDWDGLDKLHDQILARLAEWAEDWTDEEQEDYGRWIYFSLSPSSV